MATKPQVQADIKACQDLIELYIQSNPNYLKKTDKKEEKVEEEKVEEPKPQQEDRKRNKEKGKGKKHAFKLMAQLMLLNNSQVEMADDMKASVKHLMDQVNAMNNWQHDGNFDMKKWDQASHQFA